MTDQNEMPEYVARNRAVWDRWGPGVGRGRRTKLGPLRDHMGTWATLESQVGIVSEPKRLDAIELGCGTGCVSARLVRLGARPVGIDNSAKQLETARRPQAKHSLDLALLHGNAEAVPYPDASFDFAISEYGAAIWADPSPRLPDTRVVPPLAQRGTLEGAQEGLTRLRGI